MSEETKNIKKVRQFLEDKKQEDKIIINWSHSGLLDGLEEDDKRILALLLEKIAQILLVKRVNSVIDTIAFPIATRCYRKLNYIIKDAWEFIRYLEIRYPELSEQFGDITEIEEVEICTILSEEVKRKKL